MKVERADGGVFLEAGMRSFTSAAQASGDPLGEALFAVDGVAGVFALPAFVTITKTPEAAWKAVMPQVEAALASLLEG